MKILFALILLVAVFFRLYGLSSTPPHPSLDEVTTGYNAYSILKTGADEFGNKFPLLLRAYDDFRPIPYTYLVIPFIMLFDLNVFAVRLPSALLSISTVIAVFFLTRELLIKDKNRREVALFAMAFMAISPWHIYLSHLGHEVNLFFSAFILGITFFIHFINKNKSIYFYFFCVSFAVSFASYQSGKLFIPVMLILLGALFVKKLLKNKKTLLVGIMVLFILMIPTVVISFSPQALIRLQATNIYTMAGPQLEKSAINVLKAKKNGDIISEALNNRRLTYLILPIGAYISHLNPTWLFSNGGEDSFKSPGLGLLHIIELPLILLGILFLIRSKSISFSVKLLFALWASVSLLPASITTGFPHAMRTIQILPIPHILSAIGIIYISLLFKKSKMILVIFSAALFISAAFFFNSYFFQLNQKIAYQFQYGVTASLIKTNEPVFVSNKDLLTQGYMFYLFDRKYDPSIYLKNGGTVSGGFDEPHKIDNYYFGKLKNTNLPGIYIVNPHEIEGNIKSKVLFPNGEEAVWIIKRN